MTILETKMSVKSVIPKSLRITEIQDLDDILKRFSEEKDLLRRKLKVARKPQKMKVFENCSL
jgi:hypothetical protein